MSKQNYQDLKVWRQSIALVPKTYRLIKQFPKEETYALADQVRRAVISIPANIAEGQARQHRKEFLQHLAIAKGSLAALHTLIIVAYKLNYLTREQMIEVEPQLSEIAKMLNGLMYSLKSQHDQRSTAN